MESRLHSPAASCGASCGSPFSDVTSGSLSDAYTPGSPAYESFDRLRADYSLSLQPASPAGMGGNDKAVAQAELRALADFHFYHSLAVGTDAALRAHLRYLVDKLTAGNLDLPSKRQLSNSATPYSDIAQPKKPGKEGTVKRPMNAFMCFAKEERRRLMASQPELHNARISKHLGSLWKVLPEEVQGPYRDLAEWLKELHRQEHPEYKYRPRKRKAGGPGSQTSAPPATATTDSGSYAAEPGPKPAKSARKSAAKPRNRVRKPTGQNHVVPASTLSELPSNGDPPTQFYADDTPPAASAADSQQHYSPDVKPAVDHWSHQLVDDVKPAGYAAQAEAAEQQQQQQQHGGAVADVMATAAHGGLLADMDDYFNIMQEQEMVMPIFNSLGPVLCDDYGFEVGSENLVQGSQLYDALDTFSGNVDDLFSELM